MPTPAATTAEEPATAATPAIIAVVVVVISLVVKSAPSPASAAPIGAAAASAPAAPAVVRSEGPSVEGDQLLLTILWAVEFLVGPVICVRALVGPVT